VCTSLEFEDKCKSLFFERKLTDFQNVVCIISRPLADLENFEVLFMVFNSSVTTACKNMFAEMRREMKENSEILMEFKDFVCNGIIQAHPFL
jgi:hypothetical protein